jgi:hypothetical protein
MKIIDEKGRLFGRINIIDFTIVLFLLSLLPLFYFGYRIFHIPPPHRIIEQEIFCKFNKVDPKIVKIVKVGDKQINATTGNTDAEIMQIICIEPYFYVIKGANGTMMIKQDSLLKQVWVKLKIRGELKSGELFYHGNSIYPGANITFSTDKYSLQGTVQHEAAQINIDIEDKLDSQPPKQEVVKKVAAEPPQAKKGEPLEAIFKSRLNSLESNLEDRINNLHEVMRKKMDALDNKLDIILSSPKIKKLIRKGKKGK